VAETPSATSFTTREGLQSNDVWSLALDPAGPLYVATLNGIDRLDPATERVEPYARISDLPAGQPRALHMDRQGRLWLATVRGVTRLTPTVDRALPAPTVAVTGISVNDQPQPISEVGNAALDLGSLGAGPTQLRIDFRGVDPDVVQSLVYRYRLEGADTHWHGPTSDRSVSYSNLPAGRYRFVVEAINPRQAVSDVPAWVSFSVLPPWWMRWWFLTMATAALGAGLVLVHRRRVAHLVALERVRTRIATDLHDDIGSSLSQIAVLSELARRTHGGQDPRIEAPLSAIAETARAVVVSLSDVVWSVDPRRDLLRDLIQRMRRFVNDVFTARGIEIRFDADTESAGPALDVEVRRQVFLMFKEVVTNAARHSGASAVVVSVAQRDRRLIIQVEDNGRGFDPDAQRDGNGLDSLRRRAESVGGGFHVRSSPGAGTHVTLTVPLSRRWAADQRDRSR
jgi:signal transduction histidine kinase